MAQEELEDGDSGGKRTDDGLGLALDALDVGVIATDRETRRIVLVNDFACRLFGYSRAQLLEMSGPDLIADEAREATLRTYENSLRKANVHIEGVLLKRSDGSAFPAEIHDRHAMLAGHDCLIGVIIDISERQRLEQERVRTLEMLALAERSANAGAWSSDLVQGTHHWSGELLRLFGLPPDAPAGWDSWRKVLHPEDQAETERRFLEALEQQVPFIHSYRIVLPDGSIRWIDAYGQLSFDEAGEPVRYSGLCVDATARRKAEQDLRLAKSFTDALIEHASVMVLGLDRSGCVRIFNSRCEEVTGYPRDQILGRDWFAAVLPHETDGSTRRFYARGQESGQENEALENTILTRDGRLRRIAWWNSLIVDPEGEPISVAMGVDVTAQRQSEAELERHRHHLEELVAERTEALRVAKEAAEAADRAKSSFLGNMSHEFRTPMNAILGLAGLALRRAEDPRLRDQLGKIEQSARQLLGIINDVLEYSRLEAERLALESVDFQLGQLLQRLTRMFSPAAASKGLKLRIMLASDAARLKLKGDPKRLSQVLSKLVDNAIRFTQAGSVTLRIGLAESDRDQVWLRFEVEDTGIGISAQALPRLFNAFEQADSSLTRQHGGTGLSLAIARRLVRMMDGEIGATSQPGAGSNFWFTARLGRQHSAAAALRASTQARNCAAGSGGEYQ
jgi:PAS domain S-box-containing protein